MQQRSIIRLGVPLAVTALAVAACGSRGDTSSSTGTGGATKTVKIGVTAPLSGDLSALGKGIQHSVELAVKQANANNTVPGWKIEVVPADDEGKADVGKNAATKLAADDDSHRRRRQPQLQRLSADPADLPGRQDHPDLARQHRPDPDHGRRLRQRAEASVRHLLPHLHDRPGPGRRSRLSSSRTRTSRRSRRSTTRRPTARVWWSAFTDNFKKAGGTIVAAETINPDESNFNAVVSKVAPSKPQAVSTTAVSTRRPARCPSR